MTNQDLVKKVYFPQLVIPLSSVLTGLVDFAIAFLALLAMMYYYGIVPGLAVVALPVFALLACVAALAAGLWLAALNVEYRDIRYTIQWSTT